VFFVQKLHYSAKGLIILTEALFTGTSGLKLPQFKLIAGDFYLKTRIFSQNTPLSNRHKLRLLCRWGLRKVF